MEQEYLLNILEGDISLIDAVNVNDIALYEVCVTVEPKHVKKMLLEYLNENISAHDLNRWAKFICSRTEYGTPYYLNEKLVDYYEDMFYVIQCLSTPEIDGEINEKQVKQYLSELDVYFK
jgi:hypothetical protein